MNAFRWDRVVRRRLVVAAFVGFLMLGCFIATDYGLGWDEHFDRVGNGEACWLFLTKFDRRTLQRSPERHHGPAVEIALMTVEKTLGLTDLRSIYFARHVATFLLFFTACIVFYRMLRRTYPERTVAVAGTLFLILSPRIFADSFFNAKDLGFLSCYVFGLATMVWFLRTPNARSAIAHGLACGLLIDVRLAGVVLPALTCGLSVALWLAGRLDDRQATTLHDSPTSTPTPWGPMARFAGWTCAFVLLFWPVLWLNPPLHFSRAWREMSQYPWHGHVRYAGEFVSAAALPWHYLPVWILITTPLVHVVFFAVGLARLTVNGLRRPIAFFLDHREEVAVAAAGIAPLVAVIVRHATVYDGWRHLFFVYPGLVCVAAGGVAVVYRTARSLKSRIALAPACAVLLVAGMFVPVAWIMVRDHPHQNVYFNRLAGASLEDVKERFELDYWGLSCRQALEGLVRVVPEGELKVFAETWPGSFNANALPPADRRRLHFVPPDRAEYVVTHFRYINGVPEQIPGAEVFAVRVAGTVIAAVHKVR